MGLLTFRDTIELLSLGTGGSSAVFAQQDVRQAIIDAAEEIANAHDWPGLRKPGRIVCRAAYTTGTVEYTNSTRVLTLTGGTWPSWTSSLCGVRIGSQNATHLVASVTDSTNLVLDSVMNPGDDVAAGSEFSLFEVWRAMPTDFLDFYGPWDELEWNLGSPVSIDDIWAMYRYERDTGDLRCFAMSELPGTPGQAAVMMYPPPVSFALVDILYKRKLRPLTITGFETGQFGTSAGGGLVSIVAGDKTLTCSSPVFTSSMVGAVVRVSSGMTAVPTSVAGQSQAAAEFVVDSYTNTTNMEMKTAASATLSNKAWVISDPIDLPAAVGIAFRSCCRKNLAWARNVKNWADFMAVYQRDLDKAKASQHMIRQPFQIGDGEAVSAASWWGVDTPSESAPM